MPPQSDRTQLSPTSFALLGLLRDRPMSAYQLAKYMQRSVLNMIWPRHVSGIYAEPKKLAHLGLVDAEESESHRGTVYRITPSGIEALERWLTAREPSFLSIEAENLVKVLFSRESSIEDFRDLLDEIATPTIRPEAPLAIERFSRGEFEFPERAHLTAAVWQLRSDISQALIDWANWMKDESADWSDLQVSDEKTAWAQEIFVGIGERFTRWTDSAPSDSTTDEAPD